MFAYRKFTAVPLVDQAGFQKLSIYLPFPLTDQTFSTVPIKANSTAIAFWSRGASNFPRRSDCYGYASDGYINLTRVSAEEVEADLNLTIDLSRRNSLEKEMCPLFVLRERISFTKKLIGNLTSWEGRPGTHDPPLIS